MCDHEVILHRLDTIWFFSNALSPSSSEKAQPEEPNRPQALNTPDASENRAPPEPARNEAGRVDSAEETPEEHCTKQRRNRSGGRDQRGKRMQRRAVVADKENTDAAAGGGFLHLELMRPACGGSFCARREKNDCIRSYSHRRVALSSCRCCGCNMPSAGDVFAMKQHLKSWAHAVASAVR